MQYNDSAEVYDIREEEYDIDSNQGRGIVENKDTVTFSNRLIQIALSAAVAYLLYEGIALMIDFSNQR